MLQRKEEKEKNKPFAALIVDFSFLILHKSLTLSVDAPIGQMSKLVELVLANRREVVFVSRKASQSLFEQIDFQGQESSH
jgi:hypothetical protein